MHLAQALGNHPGPGPGWLGWSLAEHLQYAVAGRTPDGRECLVI